MATAYTSTDSTTLSKHDEAVINAVEPTLQRGRQLQEWWRRAHSREQYAQKLDLIRSFNRPYEGFAFFDDAPVDDKSLPVMGLIDEMYFDQPKSSQVDDFRRQLREFALRYFMRVSDFRRPEAFPTHGGTPNKSWFSNISWCPDPETEREGFGFRQLYYKLRGGGIGVFSDRERFAIVDLRDLIDRYEWIVVQVKIFAFQFSIQPLGGDAPQLIVPLQESSYLVLSSDFITDDDRPNVEVAGERCIGEYGVGYSFLKNPQPDVLAYGPGEFDEAIQLINFRVGASGRTHAFLVFVANRPTRVSNVPVLPVDLGLRMADAMSFGMASKLMSPVKQAYECVPERLRTFDPVSTFVQGANLATGGRAAKDLCISMEQLEQVFLVRHFMQHYDVIYNSLIP